MTKITKAIIGVVITVLIIALVYLLVIKKQKEEIKQTNIESSRPKQESILNKQEVKTQPPVISTIIITGTIAKISKGEIEIQNSEAKNAVSLTNDTAVLLTTKDGVEKKSLSELKKGQNVSILLNQSDSKVISIQIIEKGAVASF